MLPNKIVATFLVVLLAGGVFAGLATAQQQQQPPPTGTDLVVEDVEVGRPRVRGVPAPINITVRNAGTLNFDNVPWQIFVGFNGATSEFCIEKGDGVASVGSTTPASPCFIRMVPGSGGNSDGTNSPNIPAGQTKRYRLMWDASEDQINDSARIFVEIMPLQNTNPGQDLEQCAANGGPDTHCKNNRFVLFGVAVGYLGVRAVPIREIPPGGDDVNDAWRDADILDPCPAPPVHVTRGCKVKAGKTLVAHYLVTNVGNVEDTYTPSLVIDEEYYRTHGYQFVFAPVNFSLGKAQQRTVSLTIVVPENETAGNKTNVDFPVQRAKWTSVRSSAVATDTVTNPGCTDPQTKLLCVNPSLPSFKVDFRRGFNATLVNDNRTWAENISGSTIKFHILLNNTGNADDVYNISFDNTSRNINDSWSPGIGDVDQVVKKNTTANYSVQVTPPANATNGTYFFDVTIRSRGDVDGNSRCKVVEVIGEGVCRIRFTVHLRQEWSIAPISDVPARVVPGETVTYNLGIRNAGNGYDNISLDLQTTVFGWDVRLSDRVAKLTPFNTTTFSLTVTSPPNVPEATVGAFFINATSGGPIDVPFESRSRATLHSEMTILRGPNMRIDVPINRSFIDAGDTTTYLLRVTNVGNVADNFTIPRPDRPSDWPIEVSPDYLELQPNTGGDVEVRFGAPRGAVVGEKATAIVKVRSTVEQSREKSVILEGQVSGPDFLVENVLVNSTTPYSGDPLDVSVVVANEGNKGADANITLRLYFVQGGVERVIGEKVYPPLSLPGQRRLVENFLWDTTGVEGPGILLARIDVDDEVREIDDSATSNEKARPVTLRTFDIVLTPATGLAARPGEAITYGEPPNVFLVEYRGNQPTEPVTIRIESEHGWLTSQGEFSVPLPRGTPYPIPIALDVPTLPGTGRDVLTVSVQPQLRPEQGLRASTTTTILDEENPRVTRIVATPPNVKLGERVNIDVHLEDATGISAVTAYVVLPTNESQALVLSKAADGRWNATKAFTVAGTYRVSVEAADAADPPNINRSRLAVGTFVVSPGSAPTVALAAGQSTTIRAGAPIRLDIRDPLGVGKVTYSIRGVSYEVRGPGFQIDTSTFSTGPVDLVVTAENIYGVATSQKFAFTVDNTPPSITRVVMTPERPRANEDVTLVIATEAKVEAVDVLVKRDGQVVQSINATRRGAGSFEVKFNPGEGDYRIDVTARDAAGNSKLAESAVVFSAKPGSPFDVPGPSLWLVLAGLAAAGLAARRRR